MNWRKKNLFYVAILIASLAFAGFYRKKPSTEPVTVSGQTMGTTYQVIYFDDRNRNFKPSIDSLLVLVNRSINMYDSASEVSRFNRGKELKFNSPYFYPPLKKGREVFEASGGAFDLTVMPLVNAWGFGSGRQLTMDSITVDSLRSLVGFEKISFTPDGIRKTAKNVQLDFGGIGQGYGADVIAGYLKSKDISDMLVELGGEGVASGRNRKTGKPWTIGILDPASTREEQFFKAYITLNDRAFTTSGNYFNYRVVDGKKYSHTIDPKSGYPVQHELLSASVFAEDCTSADAWATAFMVMGHSKAIELLKQLPEMDVILMYTTDHGIELFISDDIKQNVILEQD